MDFGKKPSVFQAKIDQSLGFHGLGQPGAASSQEQPGEEPAAARRAGSSQEQPRGELGAARRERQPAAGSQHKLRTARK